MRILSKESFTTIQPLLTDNYSNLYSRLSLQLPPEVASCFARFTMLAAHNSGQWSIDCEGEEEYKPITRATPSEKMAAAHAYRRFSEQLKRSGNIAGVDRLLSVPDESCIYYRMLPSGGARIVISQWGYRRIGSAAGVNNVSIILGGGEDDTAREDVNLLLQWSDEIPIADTAVKIGIYGDTLDKKSDEAGLVKLGSVAVGDRFTVDMEGHDTVIMRCDGHNGEYVVTIPWLVDATVRCVDVKDEPKPGTYNVNGNATATDSDGVLRIKDIKLHKDETLDVDFKGASVQKFPLKRDSSANNFTYVVATPPEPHFPPAGDTDGAKDPDDDMPDLNVRIHVVDKKKRPLPYTQVRVELRKGVRTAVTDGDGYISFSRDLFTPGEKVKVRVLKNSGKPSGPSIPPGGARQPVKSAPATAPSPAPAVPPVPTVAKPPQLKGNGEGKPVPPPVPTL